MDTEGLPGSGIPATEEAPDRFVGRNVGGKFVLDKKLGEGAMGAVYRARQTALEKVVAIKVMHGELARDPMFAARFHREAKAASRLDHPNSIRILDYGEDPDGLLYIAMEYLDGKDLAHLIVSEWPLSTARTVDLLSQALGAIAVAHDLGITHRDLKPENIMVLRRSTDDGVGIDVVKVCDFGIAKLVEADDADAAGAAGTAGRSRGKLTTAGLVIGTPAYMSPEQGRGEAIDGRSDLYSMGVILYQLLTGQLPFDAPSAIGLVLKHQTEPPPPPSSVNPGVDRQLEAVCLRALEKAPLQRYQTARELRAAIRAAVDAPSPHSLEARSIVQVQPAALRTASEPELARTELLAAPVVTAPALVTSAAVPDVHPAPPSRGRSVVAAGIGMVAALGAVGAWQMKAHPHRAPVHAASADVPEPDPTPTARATPPTGQTLATDEKPVALPIPVPVHPDRESPRKPAQARATGVETPRLSPGQMLLPSEPAKVDIAPRTVELPVPPPPPAVPAPPAPEPAPPVVAPAAPTFVLATATVQLGTPRAEGMGTTGVATVMGHLRGDIIQCYKRALPALAIPNEGAGTLHIETDDGTIVKASARLPVGGTLASCIEGVVRGARIPDADTGDARADVPLELKAR